MSVKALPIPRIDFITYKINIIIVNLRLVNSKASKVIKYVLSLLLAAALLYFAFRGIDWKEFWEGLKTTKWFYVILSVLAAVVALVFRAERWRLQLVILDGDITRRSIWHGSNIGNFMSLVIPGVGEFIRCGHVSTKKAGYDRTFGTIILERAWDLLAVFFLLLLAVATNSAKLIPFMREEVFKPFASRFSFSLGWIILLFVLMAIALLWAVFHYREKSRFCGKCAEILGGILQGIKAFGQMRLKGVFLLYTVGIWMSYIFMTYFTFLAVPGLDHLTFGDAVFISAVGNIASVIPTPGNLGAYHYLVGIAISTIYLGATEILATPLLFATLSHGSHAVLLILLAIYSYIALAIRKKGNS